MAKRTQLTIQSLRFAVCGENFEEKKKQQRKKDEETQYYLKYYVWKSSIDLYTLTILTNPFLKKKTTEKKKSFTCVHAHCVLLFVDFGEFILLSH